MWLQERICLDISGAYLTVNLKTDESVGERGFKLILEDMTESHHRKAILGPNCLLMVSNYIY